MTDKLPLILWSGGLDSTYLVWDHVSNGRSVDVMYINLHNNVESCKREIAARDQIKKLLEQFKEGRIRNDIIVDMPSMDVADEVQMSQALVWMFAYHLNFDTLKHSHAELAYVRGDDFWHISNSIAEAHKHLLRCFRGEEQFRIKYPMEWMDKTTIYKDFNQNEFSRQLLQYVVWCEREESSNDCDCASCTKMNYVQYMYDKESTEKE